MQYTTSPLPHRANISNLYNFRHHRSTKCTKEEKFLLEFDDAVKVSQSSAAFILSTNLTAAWISERYCLKSESISAAFRVDSLRRKP